MFTSSPGNWTKSSPISWHRTARAASCGIAGCSSLSSTAAMDTTVMQRARSTFGRKPGMMWLPLIIEARAKLVWQGVRRGGAGQYFGIPSWPRPLLLPMGRGAALGGTGSSPTCPPTLHGFSARARPEDAVLRPSPAGVAVPRSEHFRVSGYFGWVTGSCFLPSGYRVPPLPVGRLSYGRGLAGWR